MLTLAFAPYNFTIAGILSPLILFYCWDRASAREAFLYGYLYGLGLFGTGVNWLHISINLYGGMNLAGALFLTYVLVAFLALYPAATGFLSRKIRSHRALWLLGTVPALWTLSEWCRSWIFTGFPWLNLGYSQTDTILGAVAPVLGVYGVSWLLSVIAALLIMLYRWPLAGKSFAVGSLICIWAASIYMNRINWTVPIGDEIRVALIQPSIKQNIKWEAEQQQRILELQLSLTTPYWGHKFIVWPETAIPMFYHQAAPLIEELQSQARAHKSELITGIPFLDPATKNYYNSIMVIGENPDIYHKRHLVPFGEYLPFNQWLRPVLDFIRIPMSDFSAGNSIKPLVRAADIPIGVSICYEDVFGEEVIEALPEAQMLLNVSNDAWFGDSLAPHQHLQMARMRARETGRYLVRATNNGISALVDEKGRVVSQLPQFEPQVLTGTVRLFTGTTPYVQYGNRVIVSLCFLFFLVAALVTQWTPAMRARRD